MDASLGIDIGSSGLRLLVVESTAKIIWEITQNYTTSSNNAAIWTQEAKIELENLESLLFSCLNKLKTIQLDVKIKTVCLTGIGPTLVFLDATGHPTEPAPTYAYTGAEDYISYLPNGFQERTGGLRSAALPYIQLLERYKERDTRQEFYKLTNILDFLVWRLSDIAVTDLFVSLPNASYTGFFSHTSGGWDYELLHRVGITAAQLPRIIDLGQLLPLGNTVKTRYPFLDDASVVSGAIDGIDAFWATGVTPRLQSREIIVGSAGTTGALRIWRKNPELEFKSKLIQRCKVTDTLWVDIIPFNNVGTSLIWFSQYLQVVFPESQFSLPLLPIQELEPLVLDILQTRSHLKTYLQNLPIYLPYIEGEPRGPHGRGKSVPGGFVFSEKGAKCTVPDLYLAVILGLVNMYYHNLQVMGLHSNNYSEIRLTGTVAKKLNTFLVLLANLTGKTVAVPKVKQSVAWATAVRGLKYYENSSTTTEPYITCEKYKFTRDISETLSLIYEKYKRIYRNPFEYEIENPVKMTTRIER